MFKVVILTISDRGSKGEREDSSGPLIQELIKDLPANTTIRIVEGNQQWEEVYCTKSDISKTVCA
jgi:molybdopterin biosynthesis enzyme MoaB